MNDDLTIRDLRLDTDLMPTGGFTYEDVAHDNRVHAGNGAGAVIAYYTNLHGALDADPEPVEQAITDLLGDLMHLCDHTDIPFLDCYERAMRHWDAEQESAC